MLLINADHLANQRLSEIRRLLRPLRKGRCGIACSRYRGLDEGAIVMAAHDGNIGEEHYRNWRFASSSPKIQCSYFELWDPLENDDEYSLQKAYLSLYLYNREKRTWEELLCVHCDPCMEIKKRADSYKCGPHLHVKYAVEPIPKAHFPLNLSNLEQVISSLDRLTNALKDAMNIIRNEIMDKS